MRDFSSLGLSYIGGTVRAEGSSNLTGSSGEKSSRDGLGKGPGRRDAVGKLEDQDHAHSV
jgi:hypothetical protein